MQQLDAEFYQRELYVGSDELVWKPTRGQVPGSLQLCTSDAMRQNLVAVRIKYAHLATKNSLDTKR